MTGRGRRSFELHGWRGSAAAFHARQLPARPRPLVWSFDVVSPAMVLGSRQGDAALDLHACRAAGVEVVHRRSGGGAVLLLPGEVVWVDVVVPADDPRFDVDVTRSMTWIGERWVDALATLGIDGVDVHRGALERTAVADRLCFAGLGPGEVEAGDGKLVGISQRRTRAAARFQCAVHIRWDPGASVALLAPPRPAVDALPAVAVIPAASAAAVASALVSALER